MVALVQTLRGTIERHLKLGKVLLGSGIVSSVWWITVDIIASRRYPGYSYLDQTISELSAEGAPTRPFLIAVNVVPYAVLTAAFGVGVWAAAGQTRAGRITGSLLVAGAVIGMAGGLLFPIMVRGTEGDLRNAMHAPYGAVTMLLFVLMMAFGSRVLGTRFRYYTYATIVVWFVFGVLMAVQSGRMVANEPTPWMGLEERISVYVTMLWFAVLAAGLLRAQRTVSPRHVAQPPLAPPRTQQVAR